MTNPEAQRLIVWIQPEQRYRIDQFVEPLTEQGLAVDSILRRLGALAGTLVADISLEQALQNIKSIPYIVSVESENKPRAC